MTSSSAGATAFKRSLTKRARIDLRTLPAAIVAGVIGGLIVVTTSLSYPAVIFTGAFQHQGNAAMVDMRLEPR